MSNALCSLDTFRQGEECAARLAKAIPDNHWVSKRPPLPSRGVPVEDHPQRHQGEQRAPGQPAEPEDFRFRHGEALPGGRDARQHIQNLWHIVSSHRSVFRSLVSVHSPCFGANTECDGSQWLHGSRVRDERLLVHQD